MNQILIVEDDPALGRGLVLALSDAESAATLAQNCKQARELLASRSFDLAIFDVGLPDGSGLDLLTQTRCAASLPIILLTANDMETDIVSGLALGADDYITKPFSLAILRARVTAQLRRAKPASCIYNVGDYSFDFDRLLFHINNKAIQLSQTEQKLLRLLVDNRGHTLTRETLLNRIWPDGSEYVEENALSVTVNRLRSKLGSNNPIKTVYGIGYIWKVAL